jgi:predicted AAA+ superfamily ATPase
MDTLKPHPSRYLAPAIRSDLERRMVFMSGPRQVGKTTIPLIALRSDGSKAMSF